MHRARTAFNLLTPSGQQNFGSWLVRQQKSKVSFTELIRRRHLEMCPNDLEIKSRITKISVYFLSDC